MKVSEQEPATFSWNIYPGYQTSNFSVNYEPWSGPMSSLRHYVNQSHLCRFMKKKSENKIYISSAYFQ